MLKSWAVPKGLPPRPGIKRLAVSVEDHPLEYINFEGAIPKGQYGGGEVWIFARGKYEITKQKKDGFYFSLQSAEISAEYRMYRTRVTNGCSNVWTNPRSIGCVTRLSRCLRSHPTSLPASHIISTRLNGTAFVRLISLDEGAITIRSRNQLDITGKFPELLIPDKAFRATSALFDAEIVCLDDAGKPLFTNVIHRIQTGTSAIERARTKYPVVCYVFDCLYLDGRQIVNEPLVRRRAWMEDAIKHDTPYRVSETVTDGTELFQAAVKMGLEGIMAKGREQHISTGQAERSVAEDKEEGVNGVRDHWLYRGKERPRGPVRSLAACDKARRRVQVCRQGRDRIRFEDDEENF